MAIVMKTNTLLMSYEMHLLVQLCIDDCITQTVEALTSSKDSFEPEMPVVNNTGVKMRKLLSFAEHLSK